VNQASSYAQLLGHVIRGYRELGGISLETMATEMGFQTRSGWSRVESGETTISASQLRRAARYLGRETWTLVKDADNLARQLEAAGVDVHDQKVNDKAGWLLGGAAILAVVAGAAASSASTGERPKRRRRT